MVSSFHPCPHQTQFIPPRASARSSSPIHQRKKELQLFTMNVMVMRSGCTLLDRRPLFTMRGRSSSGPFSSRNDLHATNPCSATPKKTSSAGFVLQVKAFALRKNEKKVRKGKAFKARNLQSTKLPSEDCEGTSGDISTRDGGGDTNTELRSGDLSKDTPIKIATRSSVLQACIITSSLFLAFGAFIRQASHIASIEGLAITDASAEVSFGFEMWHIELIIGLTVLVTSCRYVLLKTWPDFAESSEAANQQVLSSLQPLDFIAVAFLTGVSEELLFRGALLPLFGLTWKSALVTGAVFGVLHLGSGRKYSFAVWALFVGFAYGLATIISSSVVVPMASHSLNNILGGVLWKFTSKPLEKSG